MTEQDGNSGSAGRPVTVVRSGQECPHAPDGDTTTPEYRRHPPQSALDGAERGNPNEVYPIPDSRSTARATQVFSGHRKFQEAKAADRKGTGTHNRADRGDGLTRKRADVERVDRPKNVAKIAHHGKS